MRALVHNAETYDSLRHIRGFADCFPRIMAELAAGKVLVWDNNGNSSELTTEHIAHIEDLEERHDEYELAVYAVLDNDTVVMGRRVHMVCYLVVSNEDYDISRYNHNTFYAMADVVNTTWDIHEMGSVLIKPIQNGAPHRVG